MKQKQSANHYQAREILGEARRSAGRFAGYIGLTAFSVAFSVVVLVTVAQQAVIWTHKIAISERLALSPAITPHFGTQTVPAATSSALLRSTLPAYGAGLNAQLTGSTARDG